MNRMLMVLSLVAGLPVAMAFASFQSGHGYWGKVAGNLDRIRAYWRDPEAGRFDKEDSQNVE